MGLPLDEVLRMSSAYPAEALGLDAERGRLFPGAKADLVQLGDDLSLKRTIISGDVAWAAQAST
jgi:N-acetylglucosamine-6-phosphate deacetylase